MTHGAEVHLQQLCGQSWTALKKNTIGLFILFLSDEISARPESKKPSEGNREEKGRTVKR